MPWTAGTVVRVTPTYSGPTCWDDEYAGGFTIVPNRADYHDQDLANAITQTLNIAGQNAMLSNLKMGGFRITELAPGVAATDAATVSQVPPAGTVENATQRWNSVALKWLENPAVTATAAGVVTAVGFVGGLSGTATNASQLGGVVAAEYPQSAGSTVTRLVSSTVIPTNPSKSIITFVHT